MYRNPTGCATTVGAAVTAPGCWPTRAPRQAEPLKDGVTCGRTSCGRNQRSGRGLQALFTIQVGLGDPTPTGAGDRNDRVNVVWHGYLAQGAHLSPHTYFSTSSNRMGNSGSFPHPLNSNKNDYITAAAFRQSGQPYTNASPCSAVYAGCMGRVCSLPRPVPGVIILIRWTSSPTPMTNA
jgi:hypothetical protein